MSWYRWAIGLLICGTMMIVTTGSALGLPVSLPVETKTLPSVYDLRNEGYPFGVMDQGVCQIGYALAGTEQFQAALWQKENQVVLFSANQAKECNWSALMEYENPCLGGNLIELVNLFSTQGVVAESCNPLFFGDGDCAEDCQPLYHLNGWQRLSTDQAAPVELIKQALLAYGPVYTKLNTALDGFSLYTGSGVLYDPDSFSTVNHAVLIVGWDDSRLHAGGSGVWIVKNSYGTDWGDEGFAYIAYGSGGIGKESSVITAWSPNDSKGALYYYDQAGFTQQAALGVNDLDAYMMALFTTQRAEVIKQIELWTTDAAVVSISVYDRFSNGELKDLLVSIPDVSVPAAGYHTISVTTQVELGAFDEVAVVAYIRNQKNIFPLAVDTTSPMPAGKNWYSNNGIDWLAFENDGFSANVGLRLRTTLPSPPPTPVGFSTSSATQTTLQLNWQPLNVPIRGYVVERQNSNTFVWERIADLTPSITTYVDTGLQPDTTYHYRLFAYNLGGLSIPAEIPGRTLPNPPAAPLGLNPVVLSPASVRLEWIDQSYNETGFRVERQTLGWGLGTIGGGWVRMLQVWVG